MLPTRRSLGYIRCETIVKPTNVIKTLKRKTYRLSSLHFVIAFIRCVSAAFTVALSLHLHLGMRLEVRWLSHSDFDCVCSREDSITTSASHMRAVGHFTATSIFVLQKTRKGKKKHFFPFQLHFCLFFLWFVNQKKRSNAKKTVNMLERKKKKLGSYTYKEKSNNNKEDRSFLCGV